MSTSRLLEILQNVKNPGSFATGGVIHRRPAIKIEGIPETIRQSIQEPEAKAIIEKCSRAPYGRGEETIVDTSVRKSWQLDPSQFSVSDKWNKSLDTLVNEVKLDLGFASSQDVSCELYKLLLYEPGGFFKPHRDTEKVDGMFGTLVIQLPSDYKGGQLAVHHQGEKKTFDFSDNRYLTYYAAFYADCQHEISEVTEGYRLCLIYNLVSRAAQAVPPAIPSEDNSDAVAEVVKIISEWTADENGPSITLHRLDHKYCKSSLSFNTLKNKDRAVADVLLNARKQVNFDMYLTIVNKTEYWTGSANPATHPCGYCDGSCGDHISDDLRASDLRVYDSITPSGKKERVKVTEKQLDGLMTTDDVEADKEEFAEATGNEGATIDKTYFRTFLLVRPHNLAALGLDGMIERLEEAIDDTPKDSTKWKLVGGEQAVLTHEQQDVCRQLANIVYNNVLQQEDKNLNGSYTKSKEMVRRMFKILTILNLNTKLESLLEFFFHQKNRFPLVSVLIPVAKDLHHQGMDKDGILLSRCIKALDDQISSTSVPCEPTNWSHDITLKCTCNDCKKLQEFLVHPNQTQFVIDGDFRASDHLEKELHTSCPQFEDFDFRGMQVVLTKTHRTFETKLQEYQDNLKTLDDLRQLSQSAADSGDEPSATHRKLDM